MRATIYARISKDREGAGLGVQTQESDCRALAASLGWTVVSVHTDNDLSAYSGKPRPAYRAMLREIEAGEVDVVLAWHTDRLHRSVTELEEYASLSDAHGVATHTVKAGHLDLATSSGRLVARLLGSTARYETEHMVERQQRAKRRSAEGGRWKGGRRPFGYEADGVTVVPAEATMLRDAAGTVLAGASLRGIAKAWNARGITTSTGKPWDMSAVRRVLLRPRCAGLMEHQGQIVGAAEWPAIIPEEQWRAVVEMLTNPARRTTTGNARKWLGSGLYVCGVCGSTVVATMAHDVRAYRCRDGHVSRTLADVDHYVEAVIVARLRRPDLADILAKATAPGADVPALEAQSVTLRARLDQLAQMFGRGEIDAQSLTAGTREIDGRLGDVRTQITDAYSGTVLSGVAEAPDPGAAWLEAPLDRRQAVLAALATVTLHKSGRGRPAGWQPGESYFRPETVRIEWRGQ